MATPRLTRFELRGTDGGPLRGDIRAASDGGGRPAVVICHGFKGFKDWGFFPHIASRLAHAGCVAVSFNFSGSGVGPDGESFSEPERFGHMTYTGDLADLDTVVSALRSGTLAPDLAPPTRLGVLGHSRGGGTAILFADRYRGIDALVTWSAIAKPLRWDMKAIAKWRLRGKLDVENARTGEVLPLYRDLLDELDGDREGCFDIPGAAERLEMPWLIVHGEGDEVVPLAEANKLAGAGARVAELLTIAHGSHTFGARHPWAGSTPELDRAIDATVNWFVKHLFG